MPTTTIPEAAAAPQLDGAEGAGEYGGPALDVGKRWEGRMCDAPGVACGGAFAKVARSGDDLYFFIRVNDDFQSYAVKPAECVAHWLADSVELLIDPRGNASQTNRDTASTFKLGIFPFTDDPTNSNGNGANGPCWSRDADNHQGYSTGPLADTVADAPNAPGVEVDVERDVGRQQRDHGRPRVRGRRLRPRGQDPDGGPPGGGRPATTWA